MLTTEKINELIGVVESYQSSYELQKIMIQPDQRVKLFNAFLQEETDLTFDWFTDYFQEEHSDRKGKKQDFTPDGIVKIANGVLGETNSNADICAGTGGLTIKRYSENPDAEFYCEEFSDRAMPFLLFNLAIRNMNAVICHGDALTRNFKHIYKLTKGNQFSDIEEINDEPKYKAKTVIMNPPYSLSWEPKKEMLEQDRFKEFGVLAPKSKADYAFLLQGLSVLDDNGTMALILPHGVLFRGQAEGKIRQKLIELNLLDAVIGLPEKAFLATDIPTVILVIKKNRQNKDILFIDASKECTKEKAYNVVKDENVEKVLKTYHDRSNQDRFSNVVSFDDAKENDFNLNIPRYVDIPQAGINPRYFNMILEKNMSRFLNKYQADINIQEADLRHFPIELHDKETQDAVAAYLRFVNHEMQSDEDEIVAEKKLKDFMMDNMMV